MMISLSVIRNKLQVELDNFTFIVNDESDHHRGHQAFRDGVITHISVTIEDNEPSTISRVSLHRKIYKALAEELSMGLHAISIRTR